MRYTLPIVLIAGGTGIIQWHSIAFWSSNVDASIGWAWSLMIEAAGLWLWYRPGIGSRMLGLLASLLLLAGPLYQISTPALDEVAKTQASTITHEQQMSMLRTQIAQDAQLMLTYAHNSKKRTGWLPSIQEVQQRLDAARKQLATLQAHKPETVENKGMRVFWLVLLQALGLVLIQVSNVLAITHISGCARASIADAQVCSVDAQHTVKEIKDEQDCADEYAQLRTLAKKVRVWIEAEGLSIAKAANQLGVDRHNLSYLVRWEKPGDRKPADAVLKVKALNVLLDAHVEAHT